MGLGTGHKHKNFYFPDGHGLGGLEVPEFFCGEKNFNLENIFFQAKEIIANKRNINSLNCKFYA